MVFIRKDLVYNKMDREIESLIAATKALPKDQKLLLLLDDDGKPWRRSLPGPNWLVPPKSWFMFWAVYPPSLTRKQI